MSSIEVLWTPDWYKTLFECIKAANTEVFLVSPWLKLEGAELIKKALAENTNKPKPKIKLLTTFNERELTEKSPSSDLEAYRLLLTLEHDLECKVEVKVVRKLHAKIYICDDRDVIVSSGNLTGPGLGLKKYCNLEIALRISDSNTAQEILKEIRGVWGRGEELTLKLLEESDKRIQAANEATDTDSVKNLQATNKENRPKLGEYGSWWKSNLDNTEPNDLIAIKPNLQESQGVWESIQKQFEPEQKQENLSGSEQVESKQETEKESIKKEGEPIQEQKQQGTVSGNEPTNSQEETSGTSSNELSLVLSQENSSESDDSVVSPVNQAAIPFRTRTKKFITATVNAQGKVVKWECRQAEIFTEDLGEGVELEMVSIPGGSFLMGSPKSEEGPFGYESPQHRVDVSPFFLGKYPVTQQQYERVMGNNPSDFTGANRPVDTVSWNYATEFCRRLSQKTGRIYRLPWEAEWEYACRAGTTTPFYFGETITTDLVNYNGNYTYALAPKGVWREQATDVGSFPPNAFGLYDMHGNVWEWCQDVWHENYKGAPTDGSAWESGGDSRCRLLRGGSWFSFPGGCRSAGRYWYYADIRSGNVGFRVVLLPGL